MKLQLLAIPLLLALMLAPFATAAAATGSITFSSPTAGSTIAAGHSYTISGTITPTPNLPDNVNIQVSTSSGTVVDATNVAVQSGGLFSYPTAAGSNFATGTYTILATDSNGATGTETISITGTTPPTSGGAVTIEGSSLVLPGQTANVWIYSSAPGTVTAWVLAPGSTSTSTISATRVSPNPGGLYVYSATYAVAAGAANGVYLVGALVTNSSSNFAASNIGSFTVQGAVATVANQNTILTDLTALGTSVGSLTTAVSGITSSLAALTTSVGSISSMQSTVNTNVASINTAVGGLTTSVNSLTTAVGTISTNVASLQTAISTLSSTVNTLSTSVSSISSSISTLTTDVSNLQTTVNGLGNLSAQMTMLQSSVSSLNSSVSNTQTYVLVAAVLVVITLVLELAILIRKLS